MRGQHEADERQRIVHLLVRELGEETGAVEHLDAEDLAGLVSGSLLKTELGRVENHLMSCAACRARALGLQHDFEAGVVPMLLRRAPVQGKGRRLFEPRLPRRWTPWILGAVAACLAVVLPLTELVPFGSSRRSVRDLSFIVRRLGNPKIASATDGDLRPAAPGAWIEPGQKVVSAAGESIEAMRPDGSLWTLAEGEWNQVDPGDLFSQRLMVKAAADRQMIAEQAERAPEGAIPPAQKPRIIHPLRRIHSLRPPIRWAGSLGGEKVQIRLHDEGADRELLERLIDSQSIHWPDEILPLVPGGRYRIELRTAPYEGLPVAEARFEVIPQEERREMEEGLRRLDDLCGLGPSMLRAEYYRQRGLFAESREELDRLRLTDSENVELLVRLKVAFRRLGLNREESRTMGIIEKRR